MASNDNVKKALTLILAHSPEEVLDILDAIDEHDGSLEEQLATAYSFIKDLPS